MTAAEASGAGRRLTPDEEQLGAELFAQGLSTRAVAAQLGVGSLWVKRDDCTGLGLGGNKVRKLEFDLAAVRPGGGFSGTFASIQRWERSIVRHSQHR